jgi:hypothetical protein
MDLNKIKRKKSEKKEVVITLRITKSQSDWLKEKDYSPNAIFQEALLDLQKSKKN